MSINGCAPKTIVKILRVLDLITGDCIMAAVYEGNLTPRVEYTPCMHEALISIPSVSCPCEESPPDGLNAT